MIFVFLYLFILTTSVHNAQAEEPITTTELNKDDFASTTESSPETTESSISIISPFVTLKVSDQFVESSCTNDGNETWYSPNYPLPYVKGARCEIYIKFEEGYKIKLVINTGESTEMDSKIDTFISVHFGNSSKNSVNYVFDEFLKNNTEYIIPRNEAVFVFISGGNGTGFSLTFEKYGSIPTTTESPTTVITLPTPNINVSAEYTIFLNIAPETLKTSLHLFEETMMQMARNYSNDYGFILLEDITPDNIKINMVIRCLAIWPNNEECSEVTYAIPIAQNNSLDYEFSTSNLKRMWDKYSDQFIRQTGWKEFTPPDNNSTLIIWISITAAVAVIFILVLIAIRHFGVLTAYNKRKLSDAESINQQSMRSSEASLWPPTPYQQFPPFMEENTMPDVYGTTSGFDDMSDEDIIDIRKVSSGNIYQSQTFLTFQPEEGRNESVM